VAAEGLAVRPGRIALGAFAATVAAFVLTVVLNLSEIDGEVPFAAAFAVFVLAFAGVGALVASRHPGNPVGWLMCASGLAYALVGLLDAYASGLREHPPDPLPGSTAAAWASNWGWAVGVGLAATFLLLLFPTGRLPSPRWRPVARLAGVALGVGIPALALAPGPLDDFPIDNPLGVPGADWIVGITGLALIASAGASIASVFARYRSAATVERQQIKWLLLAASLVGATIAALLVLAVLGLGSDEMVNAAVTGSISAIPVAMGIAILRHGLFDVDLVINRTLVYAALTATLVAAYVGAVLLLQLALSPLTEDSGLAIAGSTLGVAALVRPLRARIQAAVDRRFYRRRYDAARTLESFGARLRDEVELDSLSGELRAVVAETMQPAHVSLWLREEAGR
jgi:hypothetical protein